MATYGEFTDFDLQNIATTSVDDFTTLPNLQKKREKGKAMKDSDFIDMDSLL